MHRFVIPALDLLYARVQKGFSRRQKLFAGFLGIALLVNFLFRAGCPPERRFFNSPLSATMYVCATPDVVKNSVPLGPSRSAQSQSFKPPARL